MEGFKHQESKINKEEVSIVEKKENNSLGYIEIERSAKDWSSFETKDRKPFFLFVPENIKNKKLSDLIKIEEYHKFSNAGLDIRGKDNNDNYLIFKTDDGVYDREKAFLYAAVCNIGDKSIFVPVNEKDRINNIKEYLKKGYYLYDLLSGNIKKADVIRILNSANISIPKNIKEVEDNWGDKDVSLKNTMETDFYDIKPQIRLFKKNEDVSYKYNGETIKRTTDIYKDSNGSSWYKIEKRPEQQMAVSLLAQSFFHISPVLKFEKEKSFFDKKIDKLNPVIKSKILDIKNKINPPKELFLSKGLNFDNLPKKEKEQIMGEYITFCSLFEKGLDDRHLAKNHNVHSTKDSYALFDFDGAGLTSWKGLDKEKIDSFFNYFIYEIKYSLTKKEGYQYKNEALPFTTIKTIGLKLSEMINFFKTDDGKSFFKAVLKKTDYLKKVLENNSSDKKEDNIYKNEDDVYTFFVGKMQILADSFIKELDKHKIEYSKEEQDELEKIKNSLMLI
jgi:hypothetical protein